MNIHTIISKTLEELGVHEDADEQRLSKIGKNVQLAAAVYHDTNDELDRLLNLADPFLAKRIRNMADCMAAAQSMIFAELAPLLPEARKTALQMNLAASRPKRSASHEALIGDALRGWRESGLSVFKQSEVTSAELRDRHGIKISAKALRDRYATFV